jgi:dolichyl-phosphate beta-glucosyltransferase
LNKAGPWLSLVMPAYDEEHRIGEGLRRVGEVLAGLGRPTEVIVVDDGSGPAGRQAAEAALSALPAAIDRHLLRHERNRGKGAAVRTGALAARGDIVAFIDADLATPPEELRPLLAAVEGGADVAIGVRRQSDGSDMRSRRPWPRRLAGWLYAALMERLLLPGMQDSQCPLKAFRGEAARELFGRQRVETWAFDAELLYLAQRLGMKVAKVPVTWEAKAGSHFRFDLRSVTEVLNLFRIRLWHGGVRPAAARARRPGE